MGERLTAYPFSGRKKISAETKFSQSFFGGGTEEKHEIKADLHSDSGKVREVKLIERADNVGADKLTYSEKWKMFKDAGLPVVPTLRKTEKGTVLMTDLRADGSEIFGKALAYKLSEKAVFPEELSAEVPYSLINRFLEILEGRELEELKNKIKEYVAQASENKILLPIDDPFELIIHPDGSWDLVIVDLKHGTRARDQERDQIEELNTRYANFFLKNLSEIARAYKSLENAQI